MPGRSAKLLRIRNPRHDHAHQFRTEPANPVGANDKVRRIEDMTHDEIRAIDLGPLWLK